MSYVPSVDRSVKTSLQLKSAGHHHRALLNNWEICEFYSQWTVNVKELAVKTLHLQCIN